MYEESSNKVYKIIKILISIVTKYKQTLKIRRFYKKNFSFIEFTQEEAMEYLSTKYNIVFNVQSIGKKKIYNVELKK